MKIIKTKGILDMRVVPKKGVAMVISENDRERRAGIFYFKDRKYHREDGPAIQIKQDGKIYLQEWYINGQKHREDGPASQIPDNNSFKFLYGKSRIFGHCDWFINNHNLDRDDQKKLNSYKNIEKVKSYLSMISLKYSIKTK